MTLKLLRWQVLHNHLMLIVASCNRFSINIDFRLEECHSREAVKDVLRRYVDFYNRQRPCFAIGYDTPDNYSKRFYRGEMEHKDTFSQRILSTEPKFVQKRRSTEK